MYHSQGNGISAFFPTSAKWSSGLSLGEFGSIPSHINHLFLLEIKFIQCKLYSPSFSPAPLYFTPSSPLKKDTRQVEVVEEQ